MSWILSLSVILGPGCGDGKTGDDGDTEGAEDSIDVPFEWADDSTLCGEVLAGQVSCTTPKGEEVRIGTIVRDRTACDDDDWETGSDPEWVNWWDDLIVAVPLQADGHFEAALPAGEYAAAVSWWGSGEGCYGCAGVIVDGTPCSSVTTKISMYVQDTSD